MWIFVRGWVLQWIVDFATTTHQNEKEQRFLCHKKRKKTKKEHYAAQFTKFANDCKSTWKLLDQVAGQKTIKQKHSHHAKANNEWH